METSVVTAFAVGLFVGANIGLIVAALLAAAKRGA